MAPPPPHPQPNLDIGSKYEPSSWPYLSHDVWYDHGVDNYRTFFGRRLPHVDWLGWLDNSVQWPVVIVISDNTDFMWPQEGYEETLNVALLEHRNLAKLFISNPSIQHPKIMPLPIGLKYQFVTTELFGESKRDINRRLREFAGAASAEDTKRLFLQRHGHQNKDHDPVINITNSVWVRPGTPRNEFTYNTSINAALATNRDDICSILQRSAPQSVHCATSSVSFEEYYHEMRSHLFVTSPAGHGLDTHCTWEALLAGCIPIVPHSTLDPMFANLPVWLVDSWEEVTDVTVAQKAKEMAARVDEFDFEMVYATGWVKAIQQAGIDANSD